MAGQHGGKRAGAGRPPGARNKATVEQKARLSDMAKCHVATAINALADVARSGSSEAARVTAAVAILDRAFGRPGPLREPEVLDPLGDLMRQILERGSAMQPSGQGNGPKRGR